MQIVIEISEKDYKTIKYDEDESESVAECVLCLFCRLSQAIKDGMLRPEHYGDLVDRNSFEYLQTLNDAIHGKMSWSDAILKIKYSAPTIIPATKEEKHCKACKYSDNGMINVESERCKACYYDGRLGGNCLFVPKQTTTKEDTIGKFVDALFFGESATKDGE